MNSWWTAKPLLVVGVPFSGKGRFPIIPIVSCILTSYLEFSCIFFLYPVYFCSSYPLNVKIWHIMYFYECEVRNHLWCTVSR